MAQYPVIYFVADTIASIEAAVIDSTGRLS